MPYCRKKSRFGLFAVQVLLDCLFAALRTSWATLFGCTWTLLGPIWALLAASWAQLGDSWAQLGLSWARLGLNLAALGRLLSSTWPLSSASGHLLGLIGLQAASKWPFKLYSSVVKHHLALASWPPSAIWTSLGRRQAPLALRKCLLCVALRCLLGFAY